MGPLVSKLDRYLGIPFVPRGRDLTGTDCYGFVWLVYRNELGIDLPRYEGACELGRAPDEIGSRIDENLATEQWIQIQPDELRVWDIVFLKRMGFNHVGICLGMPRIMHMHKSGVVIDNIERTARGQGRIEACFRHRSLAA